MSACRDEFSLAALRLRYHDRSAFSRTPAYLFRQWWDWPAAFVVYRSLIAVVTTAILVFLLVYHYHVQGRSDPWPIALTSWCFAALTAHMVVAMVVCIVEFVSGKTAGPNTGNADDNMPGHISTGNTGTVEEIPLNENNVETIPINNTLPWYLKAHWILHNTSITSAFSVTTVYWTLDKRIVSVSSILEHIVNALLALLDLSMSGTPVRILNVLYPVAFAAAYAIFYVIYWAAGGKGRDGATAIYAILDFGKDPGMAAGLLVGLVFVGVPVFHLLTFGLYRLRELIVMKTTGRNQTTTLQSQSTSSSNAHPQV